MTRKILLITTDDNTEGFLKVSALTITKLNHQITFSDNDKEKDFDLIIIDFDENFEERIMKLKKYRESDCFRNKKILGIHTDISEEKQKEIFLNGCDSIMKKSELYQAVDNVIIF